MAVLWLLGSSITKGPIFWWCIRMLVVFTAAILYLMSVALLLRLSQCRPIMLLPHLSCVSCCNNGYNCRTGGAATRACNYIALEIA